MKNWETLEPDRVKLLNKHFTPGRGGDRETLEDALKEAE